MCGLLDKSVALLANDLITGADETDWWLGRGRVEGLEGGGCWGGGN